MKTLAFVLLFASICAAQQPCPLSIVKVNHASSHWSDGDPRTMSVKVQNTSSKEVVAAQYQFTYTDKLGHITSVDKGEPVDVHESGRKTLRPGKTGTQFFDASLLRPHDSPEVAVIAVKFADGTAWEQKDAH